MGWFGKKNKKENKKSRATAENDHDKKGKSLLPPVYSFKDAANSTINKAKQYGSDTFSNVTSGAKTMYHGAKTVKDFGKSGLASGAAFIADKLGKEDLADNLYSTSEIFSESSKEQFGKTKDNLIDTGQGLLNQAGDIATNGISTISSASKTLYHGTKGAIEYGASGLAKGAGNISNQLGNEGLANNLHIISDDLSASSYDQLDKTTKALIQTGQHGINTLSSALNQENKISDEEIANTKGLVETFDKNFVPAEDDSELVNIGNEIIGQAVEWGAEKTGLDEPIEYGGFAYNSIEKVLKARDYAAGGLDYMEENLDRRGLEIVPEIVESVSNKLFINPANQINEQLDDGNYIGSAETLYNAASLDNIITNSFAGVVQGSTNHLVDKNVISSSSKANIDSFADFAVNAALTYDKFNKEQNLKKASSNSERKAVTQGLPELPEGHYYSNSKLDNLYINRNHTHDEQGNKISKLKIVTDILGNKKVINTATNKVLSSTFNKPNKTLVAKYILGNALNKDKSSDRKESELFTDFNKDSKPKDLYNAWNTIKDMK